MYRMLLISLSSSSMLVPYYEDTIRAFSNGFKANAWELRRLGINGLTKITEFSEEMTFMDIHYERTINIHSFRNQSIKESKLALNFFLQPRQRQLSER